MKNNIVVMNLSGTYEKENFYKDADSKVIDCKEISGTNCYCDEEGARLLKNKIKDFTSDGIHFIKWNKNTRDFIHQCSCSK